MTKPKERVKIYIVNPTWGYCYEKDYELLEGDAIESEEMFYNIEPIQVRNAFGKSKLEKADYMRTPEGAINYAIYRQSLQVKRAEDDLERQNKLMEKLKEIKENVEVGMV